MTNDLGSYRRVSSIAALEQRVIAQQHLGLHHAHSRRRLDHHDAAAFARQRLAKLLEVAGGAEEVGHERAWGR